MPVPIIIPLINPNEPEALLASLDVCDGQKIEAGDFICTLETTKSTHEVFAEHSGFIVGIPFQEGNTVKAGDVIGYIAESPDWEPIPEAEAPEADDTLPLSDIRITKPALKFAREKNFDLNLLPKNQLVTEAMIRAMLQDIESSKPSLSKNDFDPTAIIIYGAGGH